MNQMLQKFIQHLSFERRLSIHTQEAYRSDLSFAEQFFVSQSLTWTTVQEKDVRAFLVCGREQQRSSQTLQRQLSALRTFYHYLCRENLANHNPALLVKAPKAKRLLPKPLDVDQMSQLLNFKAENFLMCRDLAIFELIYSAGLRVSEVSALNIDHLDLPRSQIRILGKGQKTRLGVIGKMADLSLKNWLKERALEADKEESALFISDRGKRLGVRSIQYRLSKIGLMQGLGQSLHPHQLRHSFASHLLESSGDLRAVQELLGHADLATTQVYTQLNFQHLAKIYDEFHPRAHSRGPSAKEKEA